MSKTFSLITAAAFCLAALPAFAEVPIKTGDSSLGPVLTDAAGMTLYTFDKDTDKTSACTGDCAKNWPPAIAADEGDASGDYTVIDREGGAYQWAYKGKPLYTWVKDAAPGDVTGDGANGVWHVAKP
jgi:predicted lipoprotein with Yx(FWY)xxD motif